MDLINFLERISDDEEYDEQMFIQVIANLDNRTGKGHRRIPCCAANHYIENVIVRYNLEEFRQTFRY